MKQTVHMRIGKNGITPTAIAEIREQITRIDPFTIKFLQNFREENDRKQAAEDLAKQTGTKISKFVGGTLILTRKR